jgi:hypothetical protein
MAQSLRRDWEKSRLIRERIDENPPRCKHCHKLIPKPRRYAPGVLYCTNSCSTKYWNRKREEAKVLREAKTVAVSALPDLYGEDQVRKGALYDLAVKQLPKRILDDWVVHKVSDTAVRELLGTGTPQALGRVRRQLFNEKVTATVNAHRVLDPAAVALLGPSDAEMQALAASDPARFERQLDDLTEAFVRWRDRFFSAGHNLAYITRPMHRKWIRATLRAIYLGERLLILSPPRHGKTDLLVHFCVWLIIRNPDIRILWVGPNGDIAENSLGQVRNLLETHEELIDTYLPQGQTFQPQNRTGTWAKDKFTVATRTQPLKMPTMWCAGVEGKILSLDCDFIVVDDPADPDRSYTPGGRAKIENWFKQKLITRKMNFTGLVMISSRVHVLDLYSNFLDSKTWTTIIDRAHDIARCGTDLFAGTENDHGDCVLFPEVNPLSYLREQADDVGPALFDMMYLNQPRPEGTLIFDPDIIRAKCLDLTRGIGLDGVTGDYRLVAGLDPAASGYQACFLWAVSLPGFSSDFDPNDPRQKDRVPTYWVVDLDNTRAGGMEGAERVMEDWYLKYGVKTWVVEDNAFQQSFFSDPRIKALELKYGLDVRPVHTGRNKHDKRFGVSGQAILYHNGQVRLPYFGLDAVRKTDMLITQLVNFTDDTNATLAHGRRAPSDILMSSWFPFAEVVRRWQRENKVTQVRQTAGESYPNYNSPSFETVPWGGTTYYPTTLN